MEQKKESKYILLEKPMFFNSKLNPKKENFFFFLKKK